MTTHFAYGTKFGLNVALLRLPQSSALRNARKYLLFDPEKDWHLRKT